MIDGFLEFIATVILNYLWKKAAATAGQIAEQVKTDRERGEINEKNVQAYEAAKTRAERRRAALDLINRNKRS